MVGFIGRLDYQKGADLVLAAAPWLISQDVQLICLGTGDSGLEVLFLPCFLQTIPAMLLSPHSQIIVRGDKQDLNQNTLGMNVL